MAKRALIGHLGKGDLGDKPGLQPMRAPDLGAWRLDGRRSLSERLHDLHQAEQLIVAEAGADLARVTQFAMLVDTKDQRAKRARLVRRGPADDDELLALDALGLDPAARTRPDILGVGEL